MKKVLTAMLCLVLVLSSVPALAERVNFGYFTFDLKDEVAYEILADEGKGNRPLATIYPDPDHPDIAIKVEFKIGALNTNRNADIVSQYIDPLVHGQMNELASGSTGVVMTGYTIEYVGTGEVDSTPIVEVARTDHYRRLADRKKYAICRRTIMFGVYGGIVLITGEAEDWDVMKKWCNPIIKTLKINSPSSMTVTQ